MTNITVVGLGYVGLSNLLLLAPHHQLIGYEIDLNRINILKKGLSPINDRYIKKYLLKYYKKIKFIDNKKDAFAQSEIIIISIPTDYDETKNYFDTDSLEKTIEDINEINPNAVIVIKSTIPFGFSSSQLKKFPKLKIIFSPEFLREGKALYDNLYPHRIIVGDKTKVGEKIAMIFKLAALSEDVPVILTDNNEAEAIKLFSNNYLAMRISFFNELDSFSLVNNLNTGDIIKGVCLDERIGDGYNNPSFGYGGYCLPKDTRQLLSNFSNTPQNIIGAIIKSNETRKKFIVENILNLNPKTVGIYRLIMKQGSDNFRSSSVLDIINKLRNLNITIKIYEPSLNNKFFETFEVVDDLSFFVNSVDIILANRIDKQIEEYRHKIFTRDIFNDN